MKDIIPTGNNEVSGRIEKTLHSVYGFNIGFAVEANRETVKKHIISLLRLDHSHHNFLDELIDQKVENCIEYKAGIEERLRNTPQIHD